MKKTLYALNMKFFVLIFIIRYWFKLLHYPLLLLVKLLHKVNCIDVLVFHLLNFIP